VLARAPRTKARVRTEAATGKVMPKNVLCVSTDHNGIDGGISFQDSFQGDGADRAKKE
jgi:hypothetical protein